MECIQFGRVAEEWVRRRTSTKTCTVQTLTSVLKYCSLVCFPCKLDSAAYLIISHHRLLYLCSHSFRVQYILNVTREIDNFFPGVFEYHNIRVYDEEATDLLAYWNDTYKFISRAK